MRIVYITATLPALTVTFIYREIFALRNLGLDIDTVSMNTPSPDEVSKEAEPLLGTTYYLDQQGFLKKAIAVVAVAVTRPRRFLRCLKHFFCASPMQSVKDYLRFGYHLIEGCLLYERFKDSDVDHIHAHFINGPTSLALFFSELLGKPFSFTMHASLIWRDPLAFKNKLEAARFCASISEYNKRYVVDMYGHHLKEKIAIVRCGVDMSSWKKLEKSYGEDLPLILAIAQLTERKGLHDLVDACRALKQRDVGFECRIVGEGAQRGELEQLIMTHGLIDSVFLEGAKKQEEIPAYIARASVFALPCVIAKDGWRDGIPVALMEAMAAGVPVITTNILGLPELVEDNKSGLLVGPGQPEQLSVAIEALLGDKELCARLGEQGSAKVRSEYDISITTHHLARLFNGQ